MSKPRTYISLFTGIGGFDLGFDRAGLRCVGQVEIDPYCRGELRKLWPNVRRFGDIRTVKASDFDEHPDIICGGFPCQDISTANHAGVGIAGTKSGLWSEFIRLIREFRILRPLRRLYAVVENVANLLNRGLGRILGDLAEIGFNAEWEVLPGYPFGADILRERLFIVAQPQQERWTRILRGRLGIGIAPHPAWGSPDSLDTPDDRAQRIESWLRQPAILRSLDGLPSKLVEHQLGGFGNAVIPQVAEWIARQVLRAESSDRRIRNPVGDAEESGENGVISSANEDSSVIGQSCSMQISDIKDTGSARPSATPLPPVQEERA